MKTTIRVITKNNYNNCNYKDLEVVAFCGTLVAAKVPEYGFDETGKPQGKMITADFSLKEVVSINSINQ
jgi:hypothetical protein